MCSYGYHWYKVVEVIHLKNKIQPNISRKVLQHFFLAV